MDPHKIALELTKNGIVEKDNPVFRLVNIEFRDVKIPCTFLISECTENYFSITIEECLITRYRKEGKWIATVTCLRTEPHIKCLDSVFKNKSTRHVMHKNSKGFGKATFLMEFAEHVAKLLKVDSIRLEDGAKVKIGKSEFELSTLLTLKKGKAFYESLGYQPVFPQEANKETYEEALKLLRDEWKVGDFRIWFMKRMKGKRGFSNYLRKADNNMLFREFLYKIYEKNAVKFHKFFIFLRDNGEPVLNAWLGSRNYIYCWQKKIVCDL
jgi:hypothetical protein